MNPVGVVGLGTVGPTVAKVLMANELALVAVRFGVAWSEVHSAVGLDRRIGLDHLTVSSTRGFHGGCLPKDLDGLVQASTEAGHRAPLLRAIGVFNRSLGPEGYLEEEAE